MKLKINQSKLKEGVGIVERVSIKSASLPILKNILVRVKKNFINLSATDLETGIKWWSLAKSEKEEGVAVPAGVLSGFVNFLPDKQADISISKNNLSIECGGYKTQIKGFDPEEFPIIPEVPEKGSVLIESKRLCAGLSQVSDIPSFSTTRPEISGIFFSFKKNSLGVVATDSYRLGEKIMPLENPPEREGFSFILPQKAAKEIVSVFGEKEGNIKIVFGANQVLFELLMEETKHPQIHFVSRLVDGEYPNYEEIMPKKSETRVVMDRAEFLNQIKAASLFSGKVNEVKLKVKPDKGGVEISSQSIDSGDFESFLPAKIKGKKEDLSFNHRFLLDGISSMKSSEISFELNNSSDPGVIKPVGESDFTYIVMPIKAS